jgi:hypothetical protein
MDTDKHFWRMAGLAKVKVASGLSRLYGILHKSRVD